MVQFLDERIDVEQAPDSPRPVRFIHRGEAHEVAEVLDERVDAGYARLPPGSRKWYTRRHRRYYRVRDAVGAVFELYFDYSDRRHRTWWLVRSEREP